MSKRWRDKQVRLIERAQDRCVDRAVTGTERVLFTAIDQVFQLLQTTGKFEPPTLSGLFKVSEDFYRYVIEEAFAHAEAVKSQDKRPRRPSRLAKGPPKLPRTLRDLVQIFGDRRYWPKIMNRSKTQTEKLRKMYVRKLEHRFKKLLPEITSGRISPDEAKAQLKEEWQTTKSRVSTIFRTETTNYFGKTQVAYFDRDPEIIGFLFDSVKDRARTDICRARHGMVLKSGTAELRENTPALHYNCRSHLIPLVDTPFNRDPMNEKSRQPSNRTLPDLPPGWRK